MRKAKVFVNNDFAGTLVETDEGHFIYEYDDNYLLNPNNKSVSLTLPKEKQRHFSKTFFPFFDGLIPEGWLLDLGVKNWKINPHDRMGLLLHLCSECIGNVSIQSDERGHSS